MQKKVISRETYTAIPGWPFVPNSYEVSYSLAIQMRKAFKSKLAGN